MSCWLNLHSAVDLGQVTVGDVLRGLVADTELEAGGAPVDELDGALCLDGGDGGVDVLGDDVSSVHHAARHVLFCLLSKFLINPNSRCMGFEQLI